MVTIMDVMKRAKKDHAVYDQSNVMCFPNGRPSAPGRNSKNSNLLEKQAIIFTVVLYIFICACLLGFHYAAEFEVISTTSIAQDAGDDAEEVATSSSSSPYNPK